MNRKRLAPIVLATVALAGCSVGPDAEQEFVSEVHAQLDTGFSESELVGLARDACDAVADGGGQQALQRLAMASGMTRVRLRSGRGARRHVPLPRAAGGVRSHRWMRIERDQ